MDKNSVEKLPSDVQNNLAQQIKMRRKQIKLTEVELVDRCGGFSWKS